MRRTSRSLSLAHSLTVGHWIRGWERSAGLRDPYVFRPLATCVRPPKTSNLKTSKSGTGTDSVQSSTGGRADKSGYYAVER